MSARLGLPPVVVHSTMSLSNWRLMSAEGGFTLDNLTTIVSFDSSRDLQVRTSTGSSIFDLILTSFQVFFMIPLLVELKAVPAIKAIVSSQLAIANDEEFDLEDNLIIIRTCIERMTSQLSCNI